MMYEKQRWLSEISEGQLSLLIASSLSLWEFTTTPSDAVSLWAGDEERQATLSQYNRPLTFPLLSRLLTLKRGALPRNSVSSETTSLRERRRRKKFVDALKIWTRRMFVRINRLPVQFCAFFFFLFKLVSQADLQRNTNLFSDFINVALP